MKNAFLCGLVFHFLFAVLMVADTKKIDLGFFHQTTELAALIVIGWVLMLPYTLEQMCTAGRKLVKVYSRLVVEKRTRPL